MLVFLFSFYQFNKNLTFVFILTSIEYGRPGDKNDWYKICSLTRYKPGWCIAGGVTGVRSRLERSARALKRPLMKEVAGGCKHPVYFEILSAHIGEKKKEGIYVDSGGV
ncbi:hypothetical protein [Desulfotomaculum copahuensis]|uniref:Uncharacterized protein n=1 Tax=Desulfotomaculum copahuensis TaxID=1838280 RepID=A0A1B7LIU1_9FIRM|nr:hypothetical protein [Desulfotomaculum copahuensis]OAT86487.1 hypothetical protein A6M21_03460 [Desulfotomaculum copahuensis]